MIKNKKTILVVDDEQDIIDLLSYNLKRENYDVITAKDGSDALIKINQNIDLIVLDVMIPKLSGYEVCDILKKNPVTSKIPIIFLTALSSTEDEYKGLKKGAYDFIRKPVAINNLLIRIKNLLNITKTESANLHSKSLKLNFNNLTVHCKGSQVFLTKLEFNLLAILMKSPSKVFTRSELLDKVWSEDTVVSDRTVDVHITKLRKKIETDEKIIFTSHGRGYFFEN